MICMTTGIDGIVMSISNHAPSRRRASDGFWGPVLLEQGNFYEGSSHPRSCTSFESDMDLLAIQLQFLHYPVCWSPGLFSHVIFIFG